MAKFKVIVSDPEDGKSKTVELSENRATPLIGRRIGEILDGSVVDAPGAKIQLMGGSDKDGFPMRPSVHGGVRRKIVLSMGVGFNPSNEGVRKRKTIRGNIVTDEIVQINAKIVGKPKQAKQPKKPKEEEPLPDKDAEPTKQITTEQPTEIK